MECKYCGAKLSLTDRFCPSCGRANVEAAEHQKKMDKYNSEFLAEKKKVEKDVFSYREVVTRVILLACIIACSIIFAIIGSNSYSRGISKSAKDAVKNSNSYLPELDSYIDKKDLLAVNSFYEYHSLRRIYDDKNPYASYKQITNAAQDYTRIYFYISSHFNNQTYRDNLRVDTLNEDLESFYKKAYPDSKYKQYDYTVEQDSRSRDFCDYANKCINALLVTYVGISEDDAQRLKSCTTAQRTLILENAIRKVEAKEELEDKSNSESAAGPAHATDSASAVGSSPATDSASAVDSSPATDSASAVDSSPAADSASAVDSSPATDSASASRSATYDSISTSGQKKEASSL